MSPGPVMGLDDPIAGEEDRLARVEAGVGNLVVHAGHQAQGHARGPHLDDTFRGPNVGKVVAGVGVDDVSGGRD